MNAELKAKFKKCLRVAKAERDPKTKNKGQKITDRWTTKTGKTYRVCDMTDRHLSNAIRHIDESLKEGFEVFTGYAGPFGDPDDFFADWDYFDELRPGEYGYIRDQMVKELEGRGLGRDGMPVRIPDLTDLEKAVLTLLRGAVAYEDAYPEVGMGPSVETLLERSLASSGIARSKVRLDLILEAYKKGLYFSVAPTPKPKPKHKAKRAKRKKKTPFEDRFRHGIPGEELGQWSDEV